MNDNNFLLLIDGSSLLTTQFYGNLPREILFAKTIEEKEKFYHKIMQTSKGVYTNAVYGFVRTLIKILKEQKPSHIAVAWDVSRATFRREMYPEYKANRGETMLPLREQFELCRELLERMNVKQFMDEHYEADDFCGTLALRFENELPVKILTKDNDYLQLVSDNTNLWMMHSTAKKTEELYKKYRIAQDGSAADRSFNFTPELVKREFGVEPSSISSLKGLQGDTSDNIKGVPGVGETTAVALIAKYKTVEALYDAIEGLDEKELKALAAEWKSELGILRSPMAYLLKTGDELVGKRAAFLSKQLATIKRDIELNGLTLEDLEVRIDTKEATRAFDELEFKSLKIDDMGAEASVDVDSFFVIAGLEGAQALFDEIAASDKGYYGLCIAGSKNTVSGAAFTTSEDKTVFIRTCDEISPEYLKAQICKLDSDGKTGVVFDWKRQLRLLGNEERKAIFDAELAAYLINPLDGDYDYSSVGRRYADMSVADRKSLLGKQSFDEAAAAGDESLVTTACLESAVAFCCYNTLKEELLESGMDKLYRELELPLEYTLASMEDFGILVKREELRTYGESLSSGIEALEKEIYERAGEDFNINSPKQLGVILFEKLKLPYGKKTKSGYSTSAEVLEKLKIEDPIIEKILEYRQLTKLKSTYADGLDEYISDDGRIHTKLNQTVTATGRLSSTEPNLQNIPIRMELGRMIRKVFVPAEGYCFLDADYSQIELRILADMSADEKLIGAYRNSQDIHRATASEVFNTPLEEVTPAQRSNAKAVNFGIVYGISSFGLGQGLNISRKEAEKYIESYFNSYPKVKEYLDGLVEEAKEKGYSLTKFGRRRPIPELSSTNFMQRSFGERIAMNSPIQGTAADIIKIAMLRVDGRLKAEKLKSRLILQIHDELLVETELSEIERVKAIMTEEMQNAADMQVRLEVEVKQGNDWFEAH